MAEMTIVPGCHADERSTPASPIDWAATLAEHDRWLRTVAFARLGERQAVDEVIQDVALAAVTQRSPIRESDRVGAWLYRLTIRQVLLYRRRCGRRRRLIDNYAIAQRPALSSARPAEPLDWLLREERQVLVRAALGRLKPRDAEILLLKYTEDWSYREIARHLGLGERAIESRLHRARQRLRDALEASE